MKHTIEGCLIKYNEPTVNGNYFSSEAFKDVTGTMVPVSTNYLFDKSESKIIGYATLENREDGVYYKATLNDEEATGDMIDLVKNNDYILGIYANRIKHDPENRKCIVDGKICALVFTPKCDDSAYVLAIDNEPFAAIERSETRKMEELTKEEKDYLLTILYKQDWTETAICDSIIRKLGLSKTIDSKLKNDLTPETKELPPHTIPVETPDKWSLNTDIPSACRG